MQGDVCCFLRKLSEFARAFASLLLIQRPHLLINALVAGDLFGSREVKYRVIHGHIGFDLIDYDPLLVRCSLAPDLN